MSGIRCSPPDDFINTIVSFLFPNPDLRHVLEINLSILSQTNVINDFMSVYPELELYYYPSKLKTLHQNNTQAFTFNSCICIVRQLLRLKGYQVSTKTLKKRYRKDKILIIRPPYQ